MIKRFLALLAIGLICWAFIPFIINVNENESLNKLSERYIEKGPDELGSANIVTSVIVSYRGFDTLGEIAVLFTATAGVGFLLKKRKNEIKDDIEKRDASEILKSSSYFLMPLIILFGVYIIINGHLTPGGGFQGGVVITSAFLLLILSNINIKLNHHIIHFVESLSGVLYVFIGILGLYLGLGFLDSRILPLGEFGKLLSAGTIPIIYSLIGLKVGSELTSVLENLRKE